MNEHQTASLDLLSSNKIKADAVTKPKVNVKRHELHKRRASGKKEVSLTEEGEEEPRCTLLLCT